MHLRQRGGTERPLLDLGEQGRQRLPQFGFDQRADRCKGRSGNLIEQIFQLVGDDARQHVLAHGHNLTELDVGRTEPLQPEAQLGGERQIGQLRVQPAHRQRRRPPDQPPLMVLWRQGARIGHQSTGQQPAPLPIDPQPAPQQPLVTGQRLKGRNRSSA